MSMPENCCAQVPQEPSFLGAVLLTCLPYATVPGCKCILQKSSSTRPWHQRDKQDTPAVCWATTAVETIPEYRLGQFACCLVVNWHRQLQRPATLLQCAETAGSFFLDQFSCCTKCCLLNLLLLCFVLLRGCACYACSHALQALVDNCLRAWMSIDIYYDAYMRASRTVWWQSRYDKTAQQLLRWFTASAPACNKNTSHPVSNFKTTLHRQRRSGCSRHDRFCQQNDQKHEVKAAEGHYTSRCITWPNSFLQQMY